MGWFLDSTPIPTKYRLSLTAKLSPAKRTGTLQVLCHALKEPKGYKPANMRRYWVPIVAKETIYDHDQHGVVIFISNTPFMGPHPVLVNCIWRLDEGELESMTTAAAFGNELCRLGRNLIRKDTHHFGSSGLSVGVGLHAYIGSKTKGTRSSYGVYGPKDKRKLEAFNAAGGTVLAAAACAEQALQRRFSDLIWNPTVQDCTNALYKATVGDDDLVTVHPRAPMEHWIGMPQYSPFAPPPPPAPSPPPRWLTQMMAGATINRGVETHVHRDSDSTGTFLVTPLQVWQS